jgi:hypothetical protein
MTQTFLTSEEAPTHLKAFNDWDVFGLLLNGLMPASEMHVEK